MKYKTSFTLSDATRKQISALQAKEQLDKQKTITKADIIELAIKELHAKKFVKE